MNRYFQPFYQPNECGKALCVRPDVMELDELYEFPEYSRDPTMYLALRNLILALWYTNCKVPQGTGANACARRGSAVGGGLRTADIWVDSLWRQLGVREGCPGPRRMFRGLPGLHRLDAASSPWS